MKMIPSSGTSRKTMHLIGGLKLCLRPENLLVKINRIHDLKAQMVFILYTKKKI